MNKIIHRLKSKPHKSILFFPILLSLLLFSCEDEPVNNDSNQTEVEEGSWVTYSPYKWSHDGEPYPSVHCIVYSDGASYEMKKAVGEFADEKFIEILDMFDFQESEDFRYPPGNEKIDVYINRFHEEAFAAAYWGSVFFTIRSSSLDQNRFAYLFRHELTHAFEFLIEGTVNLGTDVWFREGIAIYCGGGLHGITDVDDLDEWIAQNSDFPGVGNPIRIHKWEDFPAGSDITGFYYYVFDLTMRYFLDPKGLGKSLQDVLNLFYDVRSGTLFPDAFQNNFGISLVDFEVEYYDHMRTYLNNLMGQ